MKRYIVELIGTFFLTLAICLTNQPIGIGLMLAAMIYLGGHVSGGHFNPAVSLTMFLEGLLKIQTLTYYIAAQLTGSFLAALVYNILSDVTFFPAPAQQVLTWEAMFIEAILTFVFCSVILIIAQKKMPSSDISISGLVIGLVLAALIFTGGDISGGVFNPAVGTGTILFDIFKGGESFDLLAIYLIGPFVGSIAASFFHNYIIGSKDA